MNYLSAITKITAIGWLVSGAMWQARAETNAPAIVVYHTGGWGRLQGTNYDQVVVAAWADGRMVWSKDAIQGGAPFQQGKFPPAKLTTLLEKLERGGVFTNKNLEQIRFGPDARYTCIVVNDEQRNLKLQSWHELFEQRANLIVTAHGAELLGGRNREAVQREQPAEYQAFRRIWREIRQDLAALVPKAGEPFTGKIPIPEKRI